MGMNLLLNLQNHYSLQKFLRQRSRTYIKLEQLLKKRLFNESDDDNKENNTDNVNIISVEVTSSVTSPYLHQQIESSPSEPFQSSGDEYVPNYAEESTSSRDTSLSIEIHEMPQILVNTQNMVLLNGQNNVANNSIQQNDDEQVGQNTNVRYFQDNFFHDNPIQIDQNVRKQDDDGEEIDDRNQQESIEVMGNKDTLW
ncbi:hypothetical protein JTB14_031496 [Gonioctena quinquepunctata]|nr:hypothetical protein JTB14_031496 [Gonioctena quinquepunctata]